MKRPFARRGDGFTLIELLVVVGIIGLLVALLVPAFTGIGRGSKMRSAVTQVRTTIALARQWAVTRNETTYVVFPADNGSYTTNNVAMALKSYSVWSDRSGYITEWKRLPNGVIFDPTQPHPVVVPSNEYSGVFNVMLSSSTWGDSSRKFPVPFPNNSNAVQQLYAISYRPDGRLNQTGGVTLHLYMREGLVETSGSAVSAVEPRPGVNSGHRIEVKPLTGGLRVQEIEF